MSCCKYPIEFVEDIFGESSELAEIVKKRANGDEPRILLVADMNVVHRTEGLGSKIGRYLQTGMPLTEKCVTVDGGAVAEPKLVIAPVGTAISELFDFCGGLKCEPAKVIYGGPMMGIAISDVNLPVIKNTNAVLALTERETALPRTTACLSCGACADACPFSLTPFLIAKAFKNKDAQTLEALSLNACMECGCCSFVCPANRPLVQTNKLAKAFLREEKAKENAKA